MHILNKYLLFLLWLAFGGHTLWGQTYHNSDAFLTNGVSSSFTYTDSNGGSTQGVVIYTKPNSSTPLWFLGPDAYGITKGTGQINLKYNGAGTAQWSVNLTNLNTGLVVAFPFIGFGYDVWGYFNGDQGLTFPVQLTDLNSLTTEVQYTLFGQYTNIDVLFDLWLMPNKNYNLGSMGAVEVEILPYSAWSSYWGAYIKTFSLPCLLNGQQTNCLFFEYDAVRTGTGGGNGAGTTILFYPNTPDVISGDLKFDAAILLKEAAATANVTNWYLPGYNVGTEFGVVSSANFTYTLNEFRIQMSTGAIISGVPPSLITNKPFTINLTVDKDFGYWSTNSAVGPYSQFNANGANIAISQTTTLWYYGTDANGLASTTNSATYTIYTNAPVLNITNLVVGQSLSNAAFTVSGTATSAIPIGAVYFQVNGFGWLNASGSNYWNGVVNLLPGTNIIKAYAVDVDGGVSLTNTVHVQYVVTNLLGLQISGLGAVVPNYSNTWLEVGCNYGITAVPASGFNFVNWTISTNWTGGIASSNPSLNFMMASNLTIMCNFIEVSSPYLTPISFMQTANQLSLNWSNGCGILLESTNLALPMSNWMPVVTNPTMPYIITISNGTPQMFFRAK
jgi:hypothetical protein